MFEFTKIKRYGIALGAAAITALGVGGIAAAQNGAQTQKPAQTKAAEPKGPDRDNIRSGDQTTPDKASAKSSSTEAPGTETKDGPGQANEAPGTETKDGPGSDLNEAPGTETKADSDGPGGHADEGNPNADHQFQGNE